MFGPLVTFPALYSATLLMLAGTGLQVGDIILRFGDRQIEKASDLPRLVGGTKPGTKVTVQVWRRGATRDLALTVDELKPEASARAGGEPGSRPGPQAPAKANALGLAIPQSLMLRADEILR